MKFSRESVEQFFKKTSLVKPSLMFRLKMHFRIIHTINKRNISYFSGFRLLIPKTVSIVLLLIMSSSITTMYAYNNPNITTGNPLYSLKTGVESIEKIIAFSPEKKAQIFTKLADRRSEEAIIIAEKTGTVNTDVIEEMKSNNNQALTHTKTIIVPYEKEIIKASLITSSNLQKENLEKVKVIAVNKAKEDQQIEEDLFSLEEKNPIFLSAPVSMENVSIRDEMLIEEGVDAKEYGIVLENDESLVISGFLPADNSLMTEEEFIEEMPDIELVDSALEEIKEISTKESLDRMLEAEEMFIN